MILERKADQDGVKKSITYLDNKINQVFFILFRSGQLYLNLILRMLLLLVKDGIA
jgi:hypothetical protein